jgi:hypothetical protein
LRRARHHFLRVVYDLAYSPFARHFEVENVRHRRELEGAWQGVYD